MKSVAMFVGSCSNDSPISKLQRDAAILDMSQAKQEAMRLASQVRLHANIPVA
jgi:hypothetical protein